MALVAIREETLRLVRTKRPAGFGYRTAPTRLDDELWSIPVDDEVAAALAMERLHGEADDGVVARIVTGGGYPWSGNSLDFLPAPSGGPSPDPRR